MIKWLIVRLYFVESIKCGVFGLILGPLTGAIWFLFLAIAKCLMFGYVMQPFIILDGIGPIILCAYILGSVPVFLAAFIFAVVCRNISSITIRIFVAALIGPIVWIVFFHIIFLKKYDLASLGSSSVFFDVLLPLPVAIVIANALVKLDFYGRRASYNRSDR